MSILAQYPTCRNPSCIHRIDTHRYNLLPIGSNTSYTSNSCLHYPNDIQQPTAITQQPSSNTFITDSTPTPTDNLSLAQPISNPITNSIPVSTDNLSLAQPISNPLDSITYPGCFSHPLPNNPSRYSLYHTNPTDLPMVSSLPASPNIAINPINGPTALWSQSTLFGNIWSYEPSTARDESIQNHAFQGRAISCISDQPLS